MGKKRTMCSVGTIHITFWSAGQPPLKVTLDDYLATISAYQDEAHLKGKGRDGVITFLLEQDWKPFSVDGGRMYFRKKIKVEE